MGTPHLPLHHWRLICFDTTTKYVYWMVPVYELNKIWIKNYLVYLVGIQNINIGREIIWYCYGCQQVQILLFSSNSIIKQEKYESMLADNIMVDQINSYKQEIIQFCLNQLLCFHVHDDYKEFLELY